MKKRALPPIEVLESLLSYSPETGELRWRHRPLDAFTGEAAARSWNTRFGGSVAGCDRRGRITVSIHGHKYPASRIAWVMGGNPMPPDDIHIDHINRDKKDDRLCNLRECTHSENQMNRAVDKRSPSGVKGVTRNRNSWRVVIVASGRKIYVGQFKRKCEAASASAKASLRYHGRFSPYYSPAVAMLHNSIMASQVAP